MKRKRRMLAILVAAAMLIGGFPMGLFDAHAAEKHPCSNKADCTVCTVADMINALPEQDDITVDNAAAVTEQIHAIDRIKCDLSDDEYDELLTLVATKASDSRFGMDVPKLYMEAVEAVTSLNVGGSLFVQKSYHVGDAQLDWEESNAVFTIECIDPETAFEPLNVALADIGSSSLSGFYSAEADGWTNKYILPAGTYKVTEIGYRAMTEDGDELSTTAAYDVNGTVTSEYAIVEVADGEESTVAVMNSFGETQVTAEFVDEYGEVVSGAKLEFGEYVFDDTNSTYSTHIIKNIAPYANGYEMVITPPNGYTAPNVSGVQFCPYPGNTTMSASVEGVEILNGEDGVTISITLVKETTINVLTVDNDSEDAEGNSTFEPLNGVEVQILDGTTEVAKWTSGKDFYGITGLQANHEYTIKVINVPDGYVFAGDEVYDATEESFLIDDDGNITIDGEDEDSSRLNFIGVNYDETYGQFIQLGIDKVYNFEIPWTGTDEITYGDAVMNLLDFTNVKCNGEPYPDGHIIARGGVTLAFTDGYGKTWGVESGAAIPAGTYSVEGKPTVFSPSINYIFGDGDPIEVTVKKRMLTKEDIGSIEVTDKMYDGKKAAEIKIRFKKEDPQKGYTGGLQINGYTQSGPKHDEVTAVVVGEFRQANAGNDITVDYTVAALTGDAAASYTLPEGGITGTATGNILPAAGTDQGSGNLSGGSTDESQNDQPVKDPDSDDPLDPAADTSDNMNPFVWFMIMMAAAGAAVAARKIKA